MYLVPKLLVSVLRKAKLYIVSVPFPVLYRKQNIVLSFLSLVLEQRTRIGKNTIVLLLVLKPINTNRESRISFNKIHTRKRIVN